MCLLVKHLAICDYVPLRVLLENQIPFLMFKVPDLIQRADH